MFLFNIYTALCLKVVSKNLKNLTFFVFPPLQKDMSLKPQERKEKWERHPGKKPRESENCVSAEPSENGHPNDAGSSEREAERGKERMKKKLPLKPSKQVGNYFSYEATVLWHLTAKVVSCG